MTALVRYDANHAEIKYALLSAGIALLDTARFHGLGFDILARRPKGGLVALEVKATKRATLTESESHAALLFGFDYVVVATIAEAFVAVGLLPAKRAA